MNKNLFIAFGVMIAVIIIGFYLIGRPRLVSRVQNTPSPSTSTLPIEKEIKISAKEFVFTPATINLVKGEKVKIILINEGTTTHNLTIEGTNLATKDIEPGQSDSIEYTPESTGSVTFFCSIDGHRNFGLVGTFVVH